MMARSADAQYYGADRETALLVDRMLYNTPVGRRRRAEKEAVVIALEYRETRLVPADDLYFQQQVIDYGITGPDPIENYVRLVIACDPDMYWLDDDADLIAGVVAAIHLLARQALWLHPTYDDLLAVVTSQQHGTARGLDACRGVYQGLRAA